MERKQTEFAHLENLDYGPIAQKVRSKSTLTPQEMLQVFQHSNDWFSRVFPLSRNLDHILFSEDHNIIAGVTNLGNVGQEIRVMNNGGVSVSPSWHKPSLWDKAGGIKAGYLSAAKLDLEDIEISESGLAIVKFSRNIYGEPQVDQRKLKDVEKYQFEVDFENSSEHPYTYFPEVVRV